MFPLIITAVLHTDFEMVIPRDSRIQDDTFSVEGRFFLYGKLEPKISTIFGIHFLMSLFLAQIKNEDSSRVWQENLIFCIFGN